MVDLLSTRTIKWLGSLAVTGVLTVILIVAIPGDAITTAATITESQALAIAQQESERAEVYQPTEVSTRRGTLREIMLQLNPEAQVPQDAAADTTAYLVIMHGEFTLGDAHVPFGHPMPQGTILAIVIDDHTGQVIGRALPPEIPPVAGAAGAPSATIVGRLMVSGGPGSVPRLRPADRALVAVTKHLRLVRLVRTTKHGAFALRMRPGTYKLAGRLGGMCPTQTVSLRSGERRYVDLRCSLR